MNGTVQIRVTAKLSHCVAIERALEQKYGLERAIVIHPAWYANPEMLEKYGSGALRLAAREGDVVHGSVMVGQSAAMVHKEQPAREIVEEIMAEAEVLLMRAPQWV